MKNMAHSNHNTDRSRTAFHKRLKEYSRYSHRAKDCDAMARLIKVNDVEDAPDRFIRKNSEAFNRWILED
jgi:hypothetical protein